jgi:hypothetical protein
MAGPQGPGQVVDQYLQEAPPGAVPNGNGGGYAGGCANGGCANGGCANGGCANGGCANGGCGNGGYANGGYAGNGTGPGCYAGAVNQFRRAAEQPCGGECGADGCGLWYGSLNALYMTRNSPNRVWTTFENGNQPNQIMSTDMGMAWQPGGEIRVGRRFECSNWAVEGVYWMLADFHASQCATVPGGQVNTPLVFNGVDFGNDAHDAQFYFGGDVVGAQAHTLVRNDSINNAEINLVRSSLFCSCDGAWNMDVLFGARFFRFADSLTWGTLQAGCNWGANGGQNEAYLDDNVSNLMYGAQVGFDARYRFHPKWEVCVGTKFAVMGNHMQSDFDIHRGDGVEGSAAAWTGETGSYPVHAIRDDVSFLAQLDVGLRWEFACHWSADVGYRVVAISGVATADSQIPFYLVDLPEVGFIKDSNSLIVHGVYAGLCYNF